MKIGAYLKASTVAEAVSAAREHADHCAYLVGGTDILVKAREGDAYLNTTLIDISGLEELRGIRDCGETLEIGALTSHAEISASPLVLEHGELLAKACLTVGSPQIRNRGTIGGNIANASPAADSLPALAAMGAKAEVTDAEGGSRILSLTDVIQSSYRLALPKTALITRIHLPKHTGWRAVFYKLGRRNALSISRMTIAAVAKLAEDGTVDGFSLAVGSVFPKPYVFDKLNRSLLGKIPTEEEIDRFAERTSDKIPEIAGIRPTTAYKQPVCRNLTARVAKDILGVK